MRAHILAIDLGKTGCRALLAGPDGRVRSEGNGAPGLAADGGTEAALAAIMAVAAPLLRHAGLSHLDAVCVGAAGMLAAPDAARTLARHLCAALPTTEAAVTSDAITSHAGALGGRAGVVLAAGTGAVAIGVGADGHMTRADGWGPRLGDEGGGAWIGFSGLRACVRAQDGRGPATTLSHAALARFGPIAGLAMAIEGHANPPQFAAGFAQDVYRAAVQSDDIANDIICHAAIALAETVAAAAAGIELRPMLFATVGGLLALGPLLVDPMRANLHAGMPWLVAVAAEGTALDGAMLLATETSTVHEASLVRERLSNAATHPTTTNGKGSKTP